MEENLAVAKWQVPRLTIHPFLLNSTTAPPNFITEIFYLTSAYNHLGLQKAISYKEKLLKHLGDVRRDLRDAEDGRQDSDEAAIRELKVRGSRPHDTLRTMLAGAYLYH